MSEMIDSFTAQKIKDFWLNNRPGCNTTHHACDCQIKRMAELEARNKKYREALGFYADDGNYTHDTNGNFICSAYQNHAIIKIAKSALGDGDNGI